MLLPAGARPTPKPLSRWGIQRRGKPSDAVWQQLGGRLFSAFVVGGQTVLAAGHEDAEDPAACSLIGLRADDGSTIWSLALSGPVAKDGLAVQPGGRIFVTLENGKVVACSH
jgi:outer membrane protein assembly factor BamB